MCLLMLIRLVVIIDGLPWCSLCLYASGMEYTRKANAHTIDVYNMNLLNDNSPYFCLFNINEYRYNPEIKKKYNFLTSDN